MNWLDLGWMKRDEAWELHPWGPTVKGYTVPAEKVALVRTRTRMIRAGVLVFVFGLVGARFWLGSWLPVLAMAAVGTLIEAAATWWATQGLPRTERPLGWDNGIFYLAKWVGHKLLLVARLLVLGLVALSLVLLWQQPTSLLPYILVGIFLGVQFLLLYLEQVGRGSDR
jgi:hypothetical protein